MAGSSNEESAFFCHTKLLCSHSQILLEKVCIKRDNQI